MTIVQRVEELLRTIRLQAEWIRLAKLYIALLETERRLHEQSNRNVAGH